MKFKQIPMDVCRYRFTAIIWVVLGLIVLSSALLVSELVRRYGTSDRVEEAVRMVAGELRFARYKSMTTNQYVAVLMPTDDDITVDEAYPAKSVRCCLLAEQPTQDYERKNWRVRFARYIDRRDWIFLPAAVYAGYTETHGRIGEASQPAQCNVVTDVNFPDQHTSTRISQMRAVIFTPAGNAIEAPQGANPNAGDIRIIIHSGIFDKNGELMVKGDLSSRKFIVVDRYTGKVSFE